MPGRLHQLAHHQTGRQTACCPLRHSSV